MTKSFSRIMPLRCRSALSVLAIVVGFAQPMIAASPGADDLKAPAVLSKRNNPNVRHIFETDRQFGMKDMALIPAGTFFMGSNEPGLDDVRPVHQVHLDSFWIDKTEVTNEQYARFVKDTGYVTVAERKPDAKDFPGAPPENLVPGAMVFFPPEKSVRLNNNGKWWLYVPGACWRHPEGAQSNIDSRMDHPVVQVAWEDANSYAIWAGKRLPSEAEFEYAARGGLDRKRYSWGDDLKPGDKFQANLWQGIFPSKNTVEDGFETSAPAASFPANGYGLFDMTGNVWEWCSDWYRQDYYSTLAKDEVVNNPKGPEESADPRNPKAKLRVQRGGSFLCNDQYCSRYLVGARGRGEDDSGCSNVGFRCVLNAGAPSQVNKK